MKPIRSFFSKPEEKQTCCQKPEQMKRGIFRMAAGGMLLLLQLLSIVASLKNNVNIKLGPGYYVGLYGPGIIGLALLVFGVLAYRKGLYSKLVFHEGNSKFAKVMKWIGFAVSGLLMVVYALSNMQYLTFDTLLPLFGTVAFCVYTLEYMGKKPSCLFSTTLILIGVTYLYNLITNAYFYTLYSTIPFVIMSIVPQLLAGILYIVIAAMIYWEKFPILVVKILGWVLLALELLPRVVYSLVMTRTVYLGGVMGVLELLFVVVLALYISALKINTLKNKN